MLASLNLLFFSTKYKLTLLISLALLVIAASIAVFTWMRLNNHNE